MSFPEVTDKYPSTENIANPAKIEVDPLIKHITIASLNISLENWVKSKLPDAVVIEFIMRS